MRSSEEFVRFREAMKRRILDEMKAFESEGGDG